MLAPARLATLPAAERAAWARYLAASDSVRRVDRESMRRELAAAGLARMLPAPHHDGFFVQPWMTTTWLRGDSGRALTASILTWQAPSGGWSKRLDMWTPRRPGMAYGSEGDGWAYVPTIDNSATLEQLRYLGRAIEAGAAPAEATAAFRRGLAYLLRAQYPNGCIPQVFPLQGGYHDAATFNDDATVNVLRLFRAAADGAYPFVGDEQRRAAADGVRRGVECLLASQVRLEGELTIWGQQHDPLTHAMTPARSYELVGLTGYESAGILDFLMELPDPSPRVVTAVHAGARWLRAHAVRGMAYDPRLGVVARPDAPPTWARLYDPETLRPMFANRDGVKLFDPSRLTDRRTGYAWFRGEAAAMLLRYDAWARRHPAHD